MKPVGKKEEEALVVGSGQSVGSFVSLGREKG